jgi:hypothetical protein
MEVHDNSLSNVVRNNVFAHNKGGATLVIWNSNDTKVFHNTFFENNAGHMNIYVASGSVRGVELINNLFCAVPTDICIKVDGDCEENLVSVNNAFFSVRKDPAVRADLLSTEEDTECIAIWGSKVVTTKHWNRASKNNRGNGYLVTGPGLDKTLHLVAGSPCIDRGLPGLVTDDFEGHQRPVGSGYDIGAHEYGAKRPTP